MRSFAHRWRAITMMNPVREEILRVLGELSVYSPDVRFGQLLANLSYLARGPTNEAIWDMEDEELLVAAKQHLETLSKRHSPVE
jgi:hypothetical protein